MGATLQLSLSKPDVHFPLIFLFSSAELTISKEYVSFICWISTDVNKPSSSHMTESQGKQKASCCPKEKLKVHLLWWQSYKISDIYAFSNPCHNLIHLDRRYKKRCKESLTFIQVLKGYKPSLDRWRLIASLIVFRLCCASEISSVSKSVIKHV